MPKSSKKLEVAAEQPENSNVPIQLQPHVFRKGQSGNPSGRPKGSVSLKEYAKNMLATMTDEERLEFMEGIPKVDIWKLAEGNPSNATDITSGGEPIKSVDPTDPIILESLKAIQEKLENE